MRRLLLPTALLVLVPLFAFSTLSPGPSGTDAEQVGLVTPATEDFTPVMYEQILREEGFPYRTVDPSELVAMTPRQMRSRFAALVFPEVVNAALPPELAPRLAEYVRSLGGLILVVGDPGTRAPDGTALAPPLLADLTGVYYTAPNGTPPTGYWFFPSREAARAWGFTPGKVNREGAVCGYGYGPLTYHYYPARTEGAAELAWGRGPGGRQPVLTERHHPGGGTVVYCAIPLGFFKANSDDLPLRAVMRTFLIRYVHLPRLVNTPGGRGGFVFNLHICSGTYLKPLRTMLGGDVFSPETPFSIHITAGPDCNWPGDRLGFDAANPLKGKPLVLTLREYGYVGSHGGWIHNYFAFNAEKIPRRQALEYLARNFTTLEDLTGERIVEYSSPGGVHPPWLNAWLEEHGVVAYYHPGDTGSSPTHPRYRGESYSQAMWAFPISSYDRYASLEDLHRARVPQAEAASWLRDLVDFAIHERVIRTFYTHPSADPYNLGLLEGLAADLRAAVAAERLTVAPMSTFAAFLDRHQQTSWLVRRAADRYLIELKNPLGLQDITVAVYVGPERRYRVLATGVRVEEQDGWVYVTVSDQEAAKRIVVRY